MLLPAAFPVTLHGRYVVSYAASLCGLSRTGRELATCRMDGGLPGLALSPAAESTPPGDMQFLPAFHSHAWWAESCISQVLRASARTSRPT